MKHFSSENWIQYIGIEQCALLHTALRRRRLHIRNRVDVESFTTCFSAQGYIEISIFVQIITKKLFNLIWLNPNLKYHKIDYCFTSLGKIIGILNPYRDFTMNKFGWCWYVLNKNSWAWLLWEGIPATDTIKRHILCSLHSWYRQYGEL